MPKVSVLMAVYNGEAYLREAIDSILNQTFEDFEFLIVNDGSTDYTKNILLSYQDSRIRVIDNPMNLGLTRSLNRGLEIAQGKYVARLDSNDISKPDRLAKQVAFLEANPDVALVGTWYQKIDEQGNWLGDRQLPCNSTEIRWDLLFYCPFTHSTVMFDRSKVVEKLGGYDENFLYAQDYELWSRVARYFQVANLEEYLVKYRINPSSITSTHLKEQDNLAWRIKKANIQYLLDIEPNLSREIEKMLDPDIMTYLYVCQPSDSNLQNSEQVIQAVNTVLKLQKLFCRHYRLNSKDSHSHLKQLKTRLSHKLISIAVYSLYQKKNEIAPLLYQAYSLNKSTIVSYQALQLVSRMFTDFASINLQKNRG